MAAAACQIGPVRPVRGSWGQKERKDGQRFVAMHRTRELRSSLEHFRAWKRQLETQLSEYVGRVDNPNPQQEHQIKTLRSDLEKVQNNVSSLQKQLDDLMD